MSSIGLGVGIAGPPHVAGYTVVERKGSGSYATVYKAYKKNGPREVVAIKCVEKSKLSAAAIENIITEITLLKVLKHENIVEMRDFQWDERYIYIIMEYCGEGDLSSFIHKRRKLPEVICKAFLQQLALALKFLRSHNVCHMDLKPQNLLLTSKPNLTLKLADFGFAQYLSAADEDSSLRGSPLYMAPEILLSGKYDARVDLWSVGIIMYECLFGRAPYSSSNFQELAAKIRSKVPIQIPAGSSISPECRDLLTRLLKHNPDERINFEAFFQHDFLDLEHAPTSENYHKAVELITKAIKLDVDKCHMEAFNLYCEALRYFVPLIHAETDSKKKTALRSKVNDYIKRAEDLKKLVFPTEDGNLRQDRAAVLLQTAYDSDFQELKRLSSVTPAMSNALEIGYSAQQYVAEGKYQMALDKFQSSLGILVPLLTTEPKGLRRELLHKQVQVWLQQAESMKALLALENLDDSSSARAVLETNEHCCIQ